MPTSFITEVKHNAACNTLAIEAAHTCCTLYSRPTRMYDESNSIITLLASTTSTTLLLPYWQYANFCPPSSPSAGQCPQEITHKKTHAPSLLWHPLLSLACTTLLLSHGLHQHPHAWGAATAGGQRGLLSGGACIGRPRFL